MTDDDVLKRFYDHVLRAFDKLGMNLHGPKSVGEHLEATGFKNIHCIVRKVPVGTWAKDPTMRIVGYYLMKAIEAILPSFAGKPFAAIGMSPEERQVWQAAAKKSLYDTSVHRYFNYYFWYVQKE